MTTMTVVVAFSLALLRQVTQERAARNEEIFNKRAILTAVEDYLGQNETGEALKVADLADDEVEEIFTNQIEQQVVNSNGDLIDGLLANDVDMGKERKKPVDERNLPVFTFSNGGEKFFILSVRGNGLWDEIWANIALKSDFNTIAGASFDHTGETPGLGAEIKDNPRFAEQFKDDMIYKEGELVGIRVEKTGADPRDKHAVDGISGATVTGDGVAKMIYNGLQLYEAYIEKLKEGKELGSLR